MDGTLIDTEPYWIRCEQELVARYGGTWTDEDALSIVGFDLMDSAEVLRTRGGVRLRPHEIVDQLSDAVAVLLRERIPWRPGARELLAALKLRGVPCALVTMSWRRARRRGPPAAPAALVPDRDHRRHGDERQAAPRAVSPRRRGARRRPAVVRGDRGLADRFGICRGRRLCRRRRSATCCRSPRPSIASCCRRCKASPLSCSASTSSERRHLRRARRPAPTTIRPSRPAARRNVSATRRRMLGAAAAAAALLLVAGGVWWFALRDTEPCVRPGSVQRPCLGAALEHRERPRRPRAARQHVPPDLPVLVRGHRRVDDPAVRQHPGGGDRRVRRQGAHPRHPARRLALRPHGPRRDGRPARRPGVAGGAHRCHRRVRRRPRLPGHRHQLRELRLQ